MQIEICGLCYNYQRRMVWHLSSLAQQVGNHDITMNIAYVKGNGSPSIEQLMDRFKDTQLKFNPIEYKEESDIIYRGNVRNRQIMESHAEWLFFADPDHVYPNDYLSLMENELKDKHDKERCYTSINKVNVIPEMMQDIIDKQTELYIDNAYEKASTLPMYHVRTRATASGCMQVVKREWIFKRNEGYYCKVRVDRDIFQQRTWSDGHFRRAMGGTAFIHLPPIVHLQHWHTGDKEFYRKDQQR